MHTIQIGNYKTSIPEKWDELNQKQLITAIRLFNRSSSIVKFELLTVLNFLHISICHEKPIQKNRELIHKMRFKRKKIYLSNTALTAITETMDFFTKIIEDVTGQQKIKLDSRLTINLIPKIRSRFKKYYGPDQKLFNITFDEFIEAETYYRKFSSTGNKQDLNKLVATLYRKKDKNYNPKDPKYNGDKREPFNTALVTRHTKQIKHLNYTTKIAVFLFFEGCLAFLDVNFPHVFSKEKTKSKKEYGPLSIIDALTRGDVTKNETIRKTNLYDVMVRLENASIKNEKEQEQLKNPKK